MFQDQEIDEELELLVLASDGLWDVVPNEVNPVRVGTLACSFFRSISFCPSESRCFQSSWPSFGGNLKIFRLCHSILTDFCNCCENSKPELLDWLLFCG